MSEKEDSLERKNEQVSFLFKLALCVFFKAVKKLQGETPLTVATSIGNLLSMRLLVAAGCNVNAQANDGATALMAAVSMGFLDCAKLLVESRADVQIKSKVKGRE